MSRLARLALLSVLLVVLLLKPATTMPKGMMRQTTFPGASAPKSSKAAASETVPKLEDWLRDNGHPVKPYAGKGKVSAAFWNRELVTPINRADRSGKTKKQDAIPHHALCFLCLARELKQLNIDLTGAKIAMLSGDQPTLELARILAECVFQPVYNSSNLSHHLNTHLENGITDDSNVVEREYHAFKEGQGAGGQTVKVEVFMSRNKARIIAEPLTKQDRILCQCRIANMIASCKTKLPLDFGKDPLFVSVLEAFARRPMPEASSVLLPARRAVLINCSQEDILLIATLL